MLLRVRGIIVKALAETLSLAVQLVDHLVQHFLAEVAGILVAEVRGGFLADLVGQFERHFVGHRQRPHRHAGMLAAFSIRAGLTPSASIVMPSAVKVQNTRLV